MACNSEQTGADLDCPPGWRVVPLPDAVTFQEGPGILAKDFRESGIPLLRLKGVEDDFVTLAGCNFLDPDAVARRWNHFRLELHDLVISTSASFGRVSEVTSEAVGAIPYTGLIRFQPRQGVVDREFLRAFLGSANFMRQVEAMASGSVIRHFGPMHLKQMLIQVPPISEQREIGEIYSAIADRLRMLRAANSTLEAIAQALFKSWFVDFDPAHTKADGREPEAMDAATAALFPSEFEESELGSIPKGWQSALSGTIYEVGIGKTPPRKEPHWFTNNAADVAWASIRDMGTAGVFLTSTSEFLTREAVEKFNVRMVPEGSILMSFKLTVGRVAIADFDMTTNEAIAHFKPRQGSLPQSFLYCFLKSFDMNSLSSTSSIANATNSKAIRNIPILHPGLELAQKFDAFAGPLLERIRMQQRQMLTLESLRDTILPRLVSGKLRLPEAMKAAEEDVA